MRGVSFMYNHKRYVIKTKEQMQAFLINNKAEPQKSQVNQNTKNGS